MWIKAAIIGWDEWVLQAIGENLKQEFLKLMRDFREGKRVSCVRWLPVPEIISREQSSPTQNGSEPAA